MLTVKIQTIPTDTKNHCQPHQPDGFVSFWVYVFPDTCCMQTHTHEVITKEKTQGECRSVFEFPPTTQYVKGPE